MLLYIDEEPEEHLLNTTWLGGKDELSTVSETVETASVV
jgi:hypothetical protein